ncbi:MAG: hypothetical protein HY262_10490 [Chloroflexi bacterium]|nr:hypothetical protein [Chloroflexota bacterium]
MAIDEEHVAHPRLYGAPAYARPPAAVAPTPLPLDPDDLPIAAAQTPAEQALAETLVGRSYQSVSPVRRVSQEEPRLEPRPLLLRALAGRILRRAS